MNTQYDCNEQCWAVQTKIHLHKHKSTNPKPYLAQAQMHRLLEIVLVQMQTQILLCGQKSEEGVQPCVYYLLLHRTYATQTEQTEMS